MAGDSAMELLFLDTFKHQSAEVNLRNFHLHPCVFNRMIQRLKSNRRSNILLAFFKFPFNNALGALVNAQLVSLLISTIIHIYIQFIKDLKIITPVILHLKQLR